MSLFKLAICIIGFSPYIYGWKKTVYYLEEKLYLYHIPKKNKGKWYAKGWLFAPKGYLTNFNGMVLS